MDIHAVHDAPSLARTFGGGYFTSLIELGFVAPDPETAYRRLTAPDGAPPNASGSGTPAIEQMRDLVLGAGSSPFVEYALMITAPHTHWQPAPIIETFDAAAGRYWIGPGQRFRAARPISFVFTPQGARAYEWADETALANGPALDQAYHVIERVASEIRERSIERPLPVGLAINHRFKDIAGPALCSTMEIPDDRSGLSFVVADRFNRSVEAAFLGQVGWPIGRAETISETDQAAAAWLNDVLAGESIDDGLAILRSLAQRGSA